MVKTSGRKRPRTGNGEASATGSGWRKVNIGLDKKNDQGNTAFVDENVDTDDFDTNQMNHYDDKNLASKADKDLEAIPGEYSGMFYGLEVLDGSQYKVVNDDKTGSKKFIVLKNDPVKVNANKITEPITTPSSKSTNSVVEKTKTEDKATDPMKIKGNEKKKKKKKNKAKKKELKKLSDEAMVPSPPVETEVVIDEEQLAVLNAQWLPATGGVSFHPILNQSLLQNHWHAPTPIQSAVLAAAILGRRNIVGAAPTGSGKTLAFLLPIYQYLLEQHELLKDHDGHSKQPLQALILTPTRELALQIHTEAEKLWKGHIGALVGGLAVAKQQRVLEKNRPAVVTATPGRLWELISSGEHAHLNDLSQIRFLVIDEADRMIQQGSFPQLSQILDAIQRANPLDDESNADDDANSDDDEDGDEANRMRGLPGIPGEAKVTMLSSDILKHIEATRTNELSDDDENPEDDEKSVDSDNDEAELDDILLEGVDDDDISLPTRPPVFRQTFVYSATLTLPASASFKPSKSRNYKGKKNAQTPDGAIAEILEKARAQGVTKIVDLTNAAASKRDTINTTLKDSKDLDTTESGNSKKKAKVETNTLQFKLPDGLLLQEIKCTQRHKDSHLYAYLMTTITGSSGPALIFCNSIAAVRRVGATLQALGLPVKILHAQMQQRSRFKAVESLNQSDASLTIVVATDVAARGLDIPSVSTVVHYDAARSIDTFIHRSGRTARGVGEKAVGSSLSLVSPEEDRFHSKIVHSLQVSFNVVHMDGRLLNSAQERVSLASKVIIAEDKQSKAQRQNQWFREKAEEAGLEIDDNCLEDLQPSGNNKDVSTRREADVAKQRLQVLISQPMQTQKFGKFLSTNSSANLEVPNQFVASVSIKSKKQRR